MIAPLTISFKSFSGIQPWKIWLAIWNPISARDIDLQSFQNESGRGVIDSGIYRPLSAGRERITASARSTLRSLLFVE